MSLLVLNLLSASQVCNQVWNGLCITLTKDISHHNYSNQSATHQIKRCGLLCSATPITECEFAGQLETRYENKTLNVFFAHRKNQLASTRKFSLAIVASVKGLQDRQTHMWPGSHWLQLSNSLSETDFPPTCILGKNKNPLHHSKYIAWGWIPSVGYMKVPHRKQRICCCWIFSKHRQINIPYNTESICIIVNME